MDVVPERHPPRPSAADSRYQGSIDSAIILPRPGICGRPRFQALTSPVTIEFQNHIPAPPLDRWINSIFHYSGFHPDHSIERVVPDGFVYLIFELDGFPRKLFDNETLQPTHTFTGAWISGYQTERMTISAHEGSEMLVVQFSTCGAFPFLHRPMHEFAGHVVPAAPVLGDDVIGLRHRICDPGSGQEKCGIVDRWLRARFDSGKEPPMALLDTEKRLRREPAASLSDIVDDYPHTHKNLIEQFKKYVGATPKTHQRVMRFNDVLRRIRNEETIAWSAIAHHCGYSDQAHFIREFKRFSGFNPSGFIKRGYGGQNPNFFPLDRGG